MPTADNTVVGEDGRRFSYFDFCGCAWHFCFAWKVGVERRVPAAMVGVPAFDVA